MLLICCFEKKRQSGVRKQEAALAADTSGGLISSLAPLERSEIGQ